MPGIATSVAQRRARDEGGRRSACAVTEIEGPVLELIRDEDRLGRPEEKRREREHGRRPSTGWPASAVVPAAIKPMVLPSTVLPVEPLEILTPSSLLPDITLPPPLVVLPILFESESSIYTPCCTFPKSAVPAALVPM